MVASRLLYSDSVRASKRAVLGRFKSVMEEVDMALYDRGSGIGFIYGNLGDLLKKVSASGAARPGVFRQIAVEAQPVVRKDALVELKEKVSKLDDMHKRLNFMLMELEGLVKKS